MSGAITLSRAGHVAELVLNHPPHNHVSLDILRDLADHVDALDADPAIRAIVLASDGKVFCAGADLVADDAIGGAVASRETDGVRLFYNQAIRLFARQKPIIAAVQGAAVGAGLGLAVAADFRVAAPEARFAANFVRLGFHPGFALSVTLPRLLGEQRAHWMMLSAERVKAEDALAWGLIDRLVPADRLRAEAHAMARQVAENAPLALLATRRTMIGDLAARAKDALDHEWAEQAVLKQTADYAEGVASTFERRAANFIGA